MTKKQFYSDPDVQEMACWIAKHFESGLEHSYYDRKKKCNWNCNGLYDAFRKYEWKGADWRIPRKSWTCFVTISGKYSNARTQTRVASFVSARTY